MVTAAMVTIFNFVCTSNVKILLRCNSCLSTFFDISGTFLVSSCIDIRLQSRSGWFLFTNTLSPCFSFQAKDLIYYCPADYLGQYFGQNSVITPGKCKYGNISQVIHYLSTRAVTKHKRATSVAFPSDCTARSSR